jgi:hypothetical protein
MDPVKRYLALTAEVEEELYDEDYGYQWRFVLRLNGHEVFREKGAAYYESDGDDAEEWAAKVLKRSVA